MNVLVSAFVPASIVISGMSFTHDLVYDTSAADLIVLNQQKMIAMGASAAQVQALLKNRWFSLSVPRVRRHRDADAGDHRDLALRST